VQPFDTVNTQRNHHIMLIKTQHTLAISLGSALAAVVGLTPSSASAVTLFQGQEYYLDFEFDANGTALTAGNGEAMNDQWAAWGVTLSGDSYRSGAQDLLLVYDSSTTGEDNDLMTGGQIGSPSEGNVLILHEDKSGNSADRPDDEARGGMIAFDFSAPLTLGSHTYDPTYHGVDLGAIRLVDIDDNPTLNGVSFRAFSGNQLLFSKSAQELDDEGVATQIFAGLNGDGDNSIWDFNLGSLHVDTAITRLEVDYQGSGAIAGLGWHKLHKDVPEPASMLGLAVLGLGIAGSKASKGALKND
jgi:hypothetical protein